jgi:hypothetical protein
MNSKGMKSYSTRVVKLKAGKVSAASRDLEWKIQARVFFLAISSVR